VQWWRFEAGSFWKQRTFAVGPVRRTREGNLWTSFGKGADSCGDSRNASTIIFNQFLLMHRLKNKTIKTFPSIDANKQRYRRSLLVQFQLMNTIRGGGRSIKLGLHFLP
jgi:hypothetical protein